LTEPADVAYDSDRSHIEPADLCGPESYLKATDHDCSPQPPATAERAAEYVILAIREQRRLRNSLLRLVGPHPDVLDLLQDVYLQILLAGQNGSLTVESVGRYAMAIARNKAFDWLRRRRVAATICPIVDADLAELASDGGEPSELISTEQELEVLVRAVERLPERCREIFILRRVYGMGQKQIAQTLGIAVNTVEQHVSKATRRLAADLGQSNPAWDLLHALWPRLSHRASGQKAREVSRVRMNIGSATEHVAQG